MKNVSSSRQYFSSTRLMAVVSCPSCPTIRGTSLRLSRLKRETQSASTPSGAWGARCANSLCKDVSDVRQVHLQRVLVFVYMRRDSLKDTSGFELVEYCTRIGVNDMVFALWGWEEDRTRRIGRCQRTLDNGFEKAGRVRSYSHLQYPVRSVPEGYRTSKMGTVQSH